MSQGATFNDVLHVAKGATFNNVLHVAQGVTLNNTLSVTGGVTLYNKLYVSQGATFNDVLHVTKGVTLNSTLYVTGGATFMSNVSVPSNISYMVGAQPFINSLTTVFKARNQTLDNSTNNYLKGFLKNSGGGDVTYNSTTGEFTFTKAGVYKVSMDFKPYYGANSNVDNNTMYMYVDNLDLTNVYMLTASVGYFEGSIWHGVPAYSYYNEMYTNGNYKVNSVTIEYNFYVTNDYEVLNDVPCLMSFYVDILNETTKIKFRLTGVETTYNYHSRVMFEKISSSATYA